MKAFKDGAVVAEFVGAQPQQMIERFLDSLVPSEADALVTLGDEQSLRRALELEPTRADAAVPLARLLHSRGDSEEALAILGRVPGSFAADGLQARIRLEAAEASGSGATTPELGSAFEALDAGDNARALDLLLEALPDADGSKDDVRRIVVGVLDSSAPTASWPEALAVASPLPFTEAPARVEPGSAHRERELPLGDFA